MLVHQFVALLKIPFIIDSCFISFLNYRERKNPKTIKALFELLWENTPVSAILIYYFIFKK